MCTITSFIPVQARNKSASVIPGATHSISNDLVDKPITMQCTDPSIQSINIDSNESSVAPKVPSCSCVAHYKRMSPRITILRLYAALLFLLRDTQCIITRDASVASSSNDVNPSPDSTQPEQAHKDKEPEMLPQIVTDQETDIASTEHQSNMEIGEEHEEAEIADNIIGSEIHDQDSGSIRQNYASLDAGATILDTSSEIKSSSSLLVPDRDRYMLIPCERSSKWVVISLSEDVHAEAVVVASYEQFSSPIKDFLVLGSLNYPTDTWLVLGNYTAQQMNGEQLFALSSQQHVRYIKLRLLTHYGNEYYCTLSQIKVYGKTFTQVISQLEKSIDAGPRDINENQPIKHDMIEYVKYQCPKPDADIVMQFRNLTCLADMTPKYAENLEAPTLPQSTLDFSTDASEGSSNLDTVSKEAIAQEVNPPAPPSSNRKAGSASNPPAQNAATSLTSSSSQNLGRLESIFVRITKKMQNLELCQHTITRSIEGLHREQELLADTIKKRRNLVDGRARELEDRMLGMKSALDQAETANKAAYVEHAAILHELQHDVGDLWSNMLMIRETITTIKAGVLCAILLSFAIIGFYLLRSLLRCLRKCQRRADLRSLIHLFEKRDLESWQYDNTDLEQAFLDGHHLNFVNRKRQFGSSYDDLAIDRRTLVRHGGFARARIRSSKCEPGSMPN